MKNSIYISLFILICFNSSAQSKKIEKQKTDIETEGKKLYRSEMASWYGSDIFDEKFPEKKEIRGGYFSYTEGDVSKCVFFSKGDSPKAICTVSFDPSYNVKTAKVDSNERDLTSYELDLSILRNKTKNEVMSDTLFVRYKYTNLNIIPIIENDSKKVYILTGPEHNGVMIFGNDYLLTFDKNNNLLSKKRLHKNIISTEYKGSVSGIHTHLPSTGEFITPTDICTLMLYEKFAKWESYSVMSKDFISIWDCKTDSLNIMTMKAWKKMSETK
jgi:hypothetical protein